MIERNWTGSCCNWLQATDGGGRSSQGFLDIVVVAGPNIHPPAFPKSSYDVSVSEGIAANTVAFIVQVSTSSNCVEYIYLIIYNSCSYHSHTIQG